MLLKKMISALGLGFALSQPANAAPVDGALALAAIRDLSGGDAQAAALASSILAGEPSEAMADIAHEAVTPATAILISLDGSQHLISLDWAEDLPESAQAFADMFRHSGLDPADSLTRLAGRDPVARGDAVGIVYLAFRTQAEAANLRILGINMDSDQYHFVLTSSQVADRWASVRIGENQYIEDSDWQFAKLLQAHGITPRSMAHPSRSERAAP